MCGEYSFKESGAGAKAKTCEVDGQSELSEHEVGALAHVRGKMQAGTECPHEYAYYYRAACDAEFYGHAHARDCERNASQKQSNDDADEYGCEVRGAELLSLVTEYLACVFNGTGFSDYGHAISQLKSQCTRWKQVDAGSVYPGYVYSE